MAPLPPPGSSPSKPGVVLPGHSIASSNSAQRSNPLSPSLSRHPTHKLSRSNSLSFLASPSASTTQATNPGPLHASRPSSPAKASQSSSPLIIHRSQSTSTRTHPRPHSVDINRALKGNPISNASQPPSCLSSRLPQPPNSASGLSTAPVYSFNFPEEDVFVTPHKHRPGNIFSRPHDIPLEELEAIQEASPSTQPSKQTVASGTLPVENPSQDCELKTENVAVCVRVRPMFTTSLSDIDLDTPTPHERQLSAAEGSSTRFGSWYIQPAKSCISLSPCHPIIDRRGTGTSEGVHGSEGYEFHLDKIFDPYSTTDDLYRAQVQSVVQSCVKDGYNATVFAYGQTGSGKTFTMMGNPVDVEEDDRGIIPRAVDEVFQVIAADPDREYLLRVSYLEIYNEVLNDLLTNDATPAPVHRLSIHENNKGRIYVNGLREEVVSHPMQVLDALMRGQKARHVGATDWNERSSRSHTVFTMTIESRPKDEFSTSVDTSTQVSHLNLIDLAGSESAATSSERRKEGAFINRSLLALSNVISKLSKHEPHIPYRDSKLTRLLQTSLSGNAKVVVVCAVSAGADSVIETLSTLRFARRAKMVVTQAERGTVLDDKSALLQAYQREIHALKAQLQENSLALLISSPSEPDLNRLRDERSRAESELTALRFERIRLQEHIEHLNRRILTRNTIESNVHRAETLLAPRRVVSGHDGAPRRKAKGRITDISGMMGVLGVGLRSGYHATDVADRSTHNCGEFYQFQREFRLEKEVKALRAELESLRHDPETALLPKNNGEGVAEDEASTGNLLCDRPKQGGESFFPLASVEDLEVSQVERIPQMLPQTCSSPEQDTRGPQDQLPLTNCRLGNSVTCEQQLKQEVEHLEQRLSLLQAEYEEHRISTQDSHNQMCHKVSELEAMLSKLPSQEVFTSQSDHVVKLESELSRAQEANKLLNSRQKEVADALEHSKADVAKLQSQLSQADEKVRHLESQNQVTEFTENALQQERGGQIQKLEKLLDQAHQKMASLATRLETHSKASELDHIRIIKLQDETASAKANSEELKQKLLNERRQTQAKELEVMQLMQERDKLSSEVQTLSRALNETTTLREQEHHSPLADREALEQAEAVARQSQADFAQASKALEQIELKLRDSQEENANTKVQLKLVEDGQSLLKAQNEKFCQEVTKLEKDLDYLQQKERKFGSEIDKTILERCRLAESKLQKTYECKLLEMEGQHSILQQQFKGLEKHLGMLQRSEPMQQTTAESMETIVDLQNTIGELSKTVQSLQDELKDARQQRNTEGRSRAPFDHYHQSTEDEVERLYGIIDEQERRLSDAKTDLAKWQAHVRNQTELIAKLQLDSKPSTPINNTDSVRKLPLPPLSSTVNRLPSSTNTRLSKSSAPPLCNSVVGQYNSSSRWSLSKPAVTHIAPLEGSPRPLPVPECFHTDDDDDSKKRKTRRRTIEKDMAKLKDENVVERKKNVLLSSTPSIGSAPKPKRVLSGISDRNNRLGRVPMSSADVTDGEVPSRPGSNRYSMLCPSASEVSTQGYYE